MHYLVPDLSPLIALPSLLSPVAAHIQPELTGLAEVPETHAWPTLHDRPYGVDDRVPVVDLALPDAVRLVGRACEEWGAFLLTGHGVPVELLRRIEEQGRRLFSLSAAHKLRAARCDGTSTGYGSAFISKFFSKQFWSEGFTVVGSPREDARKIWPDGHQDFCGAIEEYSRLMDDLARRLMHLMLLFLGLSDEEISWVGPLKAQHEAVPALQLNYYPRCPEPDRAMGLAEHTDSSLVTIIHQSSGVAGLQLLRDGDGGGAARWVAVAPITGALVVIVGDLFQVMSNGRFRSVVHRAVVDRTRARISVAYFCGPPAELKISPIGKLMGSGRGPAYRGVTWPEYLRLKKKLYNEALASLRLSAGKGGEKEKLEVYISS
ncbi:gibberellin 3-beta-dioxygenase 1-like [Zingiber officinale]|uniref:gibberellin 3-beta-dioxygenase 1-like n=1 Tax=Zingiber officinale TaxID=94328 RepID=UPI001C4C83E8|nr:gibberellin 3-beta-dioxygenase 1-like [Zingiber officinale]